MFKMINGAPVRVASCDTNSTRDLPLSGRCVRGWNSRLKLCLDIRGNTFTRFSRMVGHAMDSDCTLGERGCGVSFTDFIDIRKP
jgi:hypothetical protein